MVDTRACKLTKFAKLMSFANPSEKSVSIMGFRVPDAQNRVKDMGLIADVMAREIHRLLPGIGRSSKIFLRIWCALG